MKQNSIHSILAVGVLVGCVAADSEQNLSTSQQALSTGNEGASAERGSAWSISGEMAAVPGLREFSAGDPLRVHIFAVANTQMDVVLEARGLDGRIARKTVASQVTIAAGSVYSVDITPADIPLQSVGGVAQVKVKMVYVEGGVTKTAQAGPLRMHVTYNAGYSRAWATTDNMLALGMAATQLQGGTSFVDSTEVMNEAVSFADNPYSDPTLAGKLLSIGQSETGRFRNASGAWVALSVAQTGLQYTGGGSFMWEDNFYQKLRDAAVIDGPAPEPLALPRSVKFCFKLSPDFRDNGTEAYLTGNLRSPASRTRATLRGYRQTDVLLDHALLDSQGCATVTLRDTNTCFQAELDPGLIGTGTTAFTVTEKGTSPIFATGICFKPTALGGPLNTVSWGPSFDNPSIRVMAVASRIATMPDNGFLRSSPTPRRIESEAGCPFGSGLDFRARNAQGTLLGYDGGPVLMERRHTLVQRLRHRPTYPFGFTRPMTSL